MVQSFIQKIMTTKPQSVRAQIKALEIGASVDFPITRYDYVVSCRTRLQTTTGMTFSSKQDKDRGVVTITRGEDISPEPTSEQ